ncbi:MAG: hypothetical protein PHY02_01750 [Phycisphaerae bacterium]|nr:hypothetical protein [Phycisphaerae bacterium]
MKNKTVTFVICGIFLILAANSPVKAIDTREIDVCCHKDLLNENDLQTIDDFVGEAVGELAKTKDFTTVAKARSVILARRSSSKESAKTQYAAQFSESARKHISTSLEAAKDITPANTRFRAILNLLILANSLEDVRLTDLAMKWLNDKDDAIRYWAVRCVTNPGIIEKLNSGGVDGSELAENIAKQLKGIVESSSPESLGLMAEFAAKVKIPDGEELLFQIADMRIKRYSDWTVEYELLDEEILKLLDEKMSSEGTNKSGAGRRFGQLYSYAIQRYVKGQDVLNDTQKGQLVSVLVETENSCIGKRLKVTQSVVKNAVEQNDYTALMQEHNRLLGDETQAGQLALKLNFDYGKGADGNRRISPLALPEPPGSPEAGASSDIGSTPSTSSGQASSP